MTAKGEFQSKLVVKIYWCMYIIYIQIPVVFLDGQSAILPLSRRLPLDEVAEPLFTTKCIFPMHTRMGTFQQCHEIFLHGQGCIASYSSNVELISSRS